MPVTGIRLGRLRVAGGPGGQHEAPCRHSVAQGGGCRLGGARAALSGAPDGARWRAGFP